MSPATRLRGRDTHPRSAQLERRKHHSDRVVILTALGGGCLDGIYNGIDAAGVELGKKVCVSAVTTAYRVQLATDSDLKESALHLFASLN